MAALTFLDQVVGDTSTAWVIVSADSPNIVVQLNRALQIGIPVIITTGVILRPPLKGCIVRSVHSEHLDVTAPLSFSSDGPSAFSEEHG